MGSKSIIESKLYIKRFSFIIDIVLLEKDGIHLSFILGKSKATRADSVCLTIAPIINLKEATDIG